MPRKKKSQTSEAPKRDLAKDAEDAKRIILANEGDKPSETLTRMVAAAQGLALLGIIKPSDDGDKLELSDIGTMLATIIAREVPGVLMRETASGLADIARKAQEARKANGN